MELEANGEAPQSSQTEEQKIEETPWLFAADLCDVAGRCSKLLAPQPSPPVDSAPADALPSRPQASEKVDWTRVKSVVLKMDGFDGQGHRLKWFKDFWTSFKTQRTIKLNWKYFLDGIPVCIRMMSPGERAWFAVHKKGQLCQFIIGYPTSEEDIYVKIELLEVKLKPAPQMPESSPQPAKPEATDYQKQFDKIAALKRQTDKSFELLQDPELALPDYQQILNKFRGLLASIKNSSHQQLIERTCESIRATQANLSLMYMKMKQFDTCLSILLVLLRQDPSDLKSLMRQAYCYEHLNALEDALLVYKKTRDKEAIIRVTSKIRTRRDQFRKNFEQHGL